MLRWSPDFGGILETFDWESRSHVTGQDSPVVSKFQGVICINTAITRVTVRLWSSLQRNENHIDVNNAGWPFARHHRATADAPRV